jgi:hypothetical protein
LDKKESTGRCLKYRRAKGEILLVTHEGRGCARHRGGGPPGTTRQGEQEAHVLARPVPGEPMMPALRNVLRVSDRPLSSLEAALAMLKARGLHYEGPELVAIVNRTSALFSQEAAKGNMRRTVQEGIRVRLWELVEPDEDFLDVRAHMRRPEF